MEQATQLEYSTSFKPEYMNEGWGGGGLQILVRKLITMSPQQSKHIFVLFYNITALPSMTFFPHYNELMSPPTVKVWFNHNNQ